MKKLFYPSAENWMWNYCTYLGPFIDSTGSKYDLGVFHSGQKLVLAAIVFGDTDGQYMSGDLDTFGLVGSATHEVYEETRKRAGYLGLYPMH